MSFGRQAQLLAKCHDMFLHLSPSPDSFVPKAHITSVVYRLACSVTSLPLTQLASRCFNNEWPCCTAVLGWVRNRVLLPSARSSQSPGWWLWVQRHWILWW